ncbi:MAG TPA: SUKH-4 family immunity protein [Streptosporangiaceae bacterium]
MNVLIRRCAGGGHGDKHEVTPALAPAGRMLAEARSIPGAEGYMTDRRPGPGLGRVRFTGTADIEGLLADAPGVRAALLEEGVPVAAFRVIADAQLTILDINGHPYIRFATATGGDPVAVELPSGRVVEMVTRHHPPPDTIVNIALYNTSLGKFCRVWEAFHAREPFYSRAEFESLEASGHIDRLRTDLLADLDRIDPGAATGLWADLAWDIDLGDFPSEETR